MSWPDAAALIHYARLMNGTCPDCGCILPHRDSLVAAMSKRAEAAEARAAKLEAALEDISSGDWQRYPERESHGCTSAAEYAARALLVSAGRDEQETNR